MTMPEDLRDGYGYPGVDRRRQGEERIARMLGIGEEQS